MLRFQKDGNLSAERTLISVKAFALICSLSKRPWAHTLRSNCYDLLHHNAVVQARTIPEQAQHYYSDCVSAIFDLQHGDPTPKLKIQEYTTEERPEACLIHAKFISDIRKKNTERDLMNRLMGLISEWKYNRSLPYKIEFGSNGGSIRFPVKDFGTGKLLSKKELNEYLDAKKAKNA